MPSESIQSLGFPLDQQLGGVGIDRHKAHTLRRDLSKLLQQRRPRGNRHQLFGDGLGLLLQAFTARRHGTEPCLGITNTLLHGMQCIDLSQQQQLAMPEPHESEQGQHHPSGLALQDQRKKRQNRVRLQRPAKLNAVS